MYNLGQLLPIICSVGGSILQANKMQRNYITTRDNNFFRRNRLWWIIAFAAILFFYFIFDPWEAQWMPQCVFHKVTGLQCMGCGAQRMLHSLLHGDIESAFHANAFLLISLPFLVFLLWVEFSRARHPELYKKIHSIWVIITISAMLAAWLILRNILGV